MTAREAGVKREQIGDVAVLILAGPPVNALSTALRGGLAGALAEAQGDPAVRCILLRGEGRGFCAGADITEFGAVRQGPSLGSLCDSLESSAKPVIAALHGMALGGGLELALAAHYRVAEADTILGLPEVNLGLVPGAGGTQRLPRLLGAGPALKLMMSGVPVRADDAAAIGILDSVVAKSAEGGVVGAALALAREVRMPRPTGSIRRGFQDGRAYLAAVAQSRRSVEGNRLPAAGRIVDLVEAALLFPLAQGLQAETAAFAELVAAPESAGLRHAFFTDKKALQLPPELQAVGIPTLASIGLWGAGEAVVVLALQALSSGLRVVLGSPIPSDLTATEEAVAVDLEKAVDAGRMSAAARDADWSRLSLAVDAEAMSRVDLVLQSDAVLAGQAVPVAALGAAGPGAEAAITVAAGPGGLAELGLTRAARAEVAMLLVALARRLQWRLVPVGPGGPVELGLRQALAAAVEFLGREGISAADATAALALWGQAKAAGGVSLALTDQDRRAVEVCMAALAAEGARMVEDGRVRRPLEVDAVAMLSGLVPRWEGGPMFRADRRGLLVLRQELIGLAEQKGVFLPPDLMDRLIADGRRFGSLN